MSDLKPLIRIYIIQYVSTQPLYKSGSLYAFLSHAMVNILVYHAKASSVYFNEKKPLFYFFHLKEKIIIYFYNLSFLSLLYFQQSLI